MSARSLLHVAALLAAVTGSLSAQTPTVVGGVTVSLSTSGRVFSQPPPPPPTATAITPPITATPPKFTASISLLNRSSRGIDFSFPSADAAQQHFIFRVIDANGDVVWQSSPLVPTTTLDTPGLFHDTLRRYSVWRQTVAVPLAIGGKPLNTGIYTLDASINGTPVFASQATFEVTAAPIAESGVRGVVLAGPVTPVTQPGVLNESPVPKAIVTYYNALMANAVVTTVIADDQGRFQFSVPPGSYIVTATIPGDENTPFGHGMQTVAVTANHVTDVVFHLDTGIR